MKRSLMALGLMLCSALGFAQKAADIDGRNYFEPTPESVKPETWHRKPLRYSVSGYIETSVFPLENEAGLFIQWEAPTFSGIVREGVNHADECKDAIHCYQFDGLGNWTFAMTGAETCKATCYYTATGDLIISDPIYLPDGSFIYQLSAVLQGNFVDERGVTFIGALGYYSTYSVPTKPGYPGIPELAMGGLSVVLQDN